MRTTPAALPLLLLGALAPVLPDLGGAEPGSGLREAMLSGWDKYDPAIRKAHLENQAEQRAAVEAAAAEKRREATPAPAAPVAGGTMVLPKMVVEGFREKAPGLPQLHIPPPAKNTTQEAFESPEARTARLIEKHITPLAKVLNRFRLPFVGGTLAGRAKKMEAAESAARQLNDIAELLELSLAAGIETPEQQKALMAEYWKAYHNRVRLE